ncbi:hypothetical protein T01_9673 [Trichinella spiralis]|uniref:Uncharacterized protein n=1 Tax=Trichinella spiralis TaxID=6334 RepID=A0A0V1B1D2_TRISP|nr:hypothetical protein T01_9673 [Trichinella spiralis]
MLATTVVINRTADDNQPITAKVTHRPSLYTSGYHRNLSDLHYLFLYSEIKKAMDAMSKKDHSDSPFH